MPPGFGSTDTKTCDLQMRISGLSASSSSSPHFARGDIRTGSATRKMTICRHFRPRPAEARMSGHKSPLALRVGWMFTGTMAPFALAGSIHESRRAPAGKDRPNVTGCHEPPGRRREETAASTPLMTTRHVKM